MSKPKIQYLVSTDSIGFLGEPEQFVELWKEYFDNKTLDGVEAIAFRPLSKLKKLVSVFKKNFIPVLSFHGKTGGEEQLDFLSKIVMTLVNYCIADVKNIYEEFPEIEFLSHAPHFEKKSVKEFIFKKNPKKIWIENHLSGKQGIEDAIEQIAIYRKNNINACGMLDIYHYIARLTTSLQTNWSNIIDELKQYFLLKDNQRNKIFCGIHFPIGTRLDDSLPIDDLTDEMLELFAKKIIPLTERVVFENQQKNFGLLFSTNKMIEEQKIRNKNIFMRLKKTGIIC